MSNLVYQTEHTACTGILKLNMKLSKGETRNTKICVSLHKIQSDNHLWTSTFP